jgi:predicted MFS family arabinose efflux permease
VHVPSVKAHFALDERLLAVALFATSLGSLSTLLMAGRFVGRFGTRNASALAGAVFCAALALTLLVPNLGGLLCAMLLLGAGESVFDVAINAEGTSLEVQSGRAVMSGFHGMFSLGAMLGASSAALMLRASVPDRVQLVGVAVAVAAGIAMASRGMLPAQGNGAQGEAHFAWPHGALLVIGLLIFSGMLAEGVMYNWSVLYVKQELGTSQDRAALAYVAFAGATAVARFGGDVIRVRFSERAMLLVGPLMAALAMGVVLLLARPWVAIAGFALVGAGLATIVPILYNAATRVPGVSRAAAIASVSSIGYLGFMAGPPILGGIAHATTLTVAMATLIVASLVLAVGSRWVPTPATDSGPTRSIAAEGKVA